MYFRLHSFIFDIKLDILLHGQLLPDERLHAGDADLRHGVLEALVQLLEGRALDHVVDSLGVLDLDG